MGLRLGFFYGGRVARAPLAWRLGVGLLVVPWYGIPMGILVSWGLGYRLFMVWGLQVGFS